MTLSRGWHIKPAKVGEGVDGEKQESCCFAVTTEASLCDSDQNLQLQLPLFS